MKNRPKTQSPGTEILAAEDAAVTSIMPGRSNARRRTQPAQFRCDFGTEPLEYFRRPCAAGPPEAGRFDLSAGNRHREIDGLKRTSFDF